MTIQVGHPHKCPTFFVRLPGGKSTGQRANKPTSWCPIGHISPIRPMPPNAKVPFSIFSPNICAICDIYQS